MVFVLAGLVTATPVHALPRAVTAAVEVPVANYVALGDSYTSGPFIPLYEQPWGCLRSTNNYPHLLAPKLALPLRDASCAGAETDDMTQTQGVTPGPNPPQFDRLDAGTTVVTLQIGGNDIGFSSIAEDCFSPTPTGTPCQDAYVVNGQDEITRRINEAAPKVAAAVAGVHTRAPSARVFVIGYPSIVPDSDELTATATCWPQLPVSPEDLPWLRAKTKELNAMVAGAATANGASYVDIYTPSIGHDACTPPAIRWVEPLVPAGPAAPVHPNLVGMLAITDVVRAAIG
jgi:lysophospholipase L1-like esterase